MPPVFHDIIQIDTVHNRIHKGEMFQADFVNLALANDAEHEMLVRVPAGEATHLRFLASLGGDGRAQIFVGPTLTADGAVVTPVNRNTFKGASSILVFSGPTVTADGTAMSDLIIPGGSGGNASGGKAGSFEEWILEPGDYLFKLTNKSGGNAVAGIALDFYEPGDIGG